MCLTAVLLLQLLLPVLCATQAVKTREACDNEPFTTPIGLEFETYCSANISGSDIHSTTGSSLEDCMLQCSVYQGPTDQGPCRAVTYIANTSTCWFKDGNATYSNFLQIEGVDTAVANATQFEPSSLACPFQNLSVQSASNGMDFEIHCEQDAVGLDFDWNNDKHYTPQHVDSLEECMEICANGYPLCYGVAFNPDLRAGYHNCYPKKSNASSALIASSLAVTHSALVKLSYNTTCDVGTYVTTNSKAFDRQCDQTADGSTVDTVHTSDFDACIDYCSTYTNSSQSCSVAVYQPSAADQYENCYLKTSAQYTYSRSGYHVAIVANGAISPTSINNSSGTTAGPSSNPTADSSSSSNSSGSSKAWIAGAVIGPLAAIALLIAVLVFLRRRHFRKDKESQTMTATQTPETPFRYEALTLSHAARSEVSTIRSNESDPGSVRHDFHGRSFGDEIQ